MHTKLKIIFGLERKDITKMMSNLKLIFQAKNCSLNAKPSTLKWRSEVLNLVIVYALAAAFLVLVLSAIPIFAIFFLLEMCYDFIIYLATLAKLHKIKHGKKEASYSEPKDVFKKDM